MRNLCDDTQQIQNEVFTKFLDSEGKQTLKLYDLQGDHQMHFTLILIQEMQLVFLI